MCAHVALIALPRLIKMKLFSSISAYIEPTLGSKNSLCNLGWSKAVAGKVLSWMDGFQYDPWTSSHRVCGGNIYMNCKQTTYLPRLFVVSGIKLTSAELSPELKNGYFNDFSRSVTFEKCDQTSTSILHIDDRETVSKK